MKKFLDSPATLLDTSLRGFAKAHADIVDLHTEPNYVCRKQNKPGKVALISGGGSGHEPLHSGFVGYGMLDAACPGQIFTSPTPDQMLAAAQTVNTGAGVLFIVKNYAGDVMKLAWQFLSRRGLHVQRSLVGNYTTSLDMAGCSLTVTLLDDELRQLWDAPVNTAALRWGC